jgi:hypothetical protein
MEMLVGFRQFLADPGVILPNTFVRAPENDAFFPYSPTDTASFQLVAAMNGAYL